MHDTNVECNYNKGAGIQAAGKFLVTLGILSSSLSVSLSMHVQLSRLLDIIYNSNFEKLGLCIQVTRKLQVACKTPLKYPTIYKKCACHIHTA